MTYEEWVKSVERGVTINPEMAFAAGAASRDAEVDDLGESLAQVKLKNAMLIKERDQLRKDVELLNKLVIEAKQAFDGVNVDSRWFDRGMAILDEALAATESKEQGE